MDYNAKRFHHNLKRNGIIAGCAIIFAILCMFALEFYVDYLEVRELGDAFVQVFRTDLNVKLIAQAISFVIVFLVLFCNTALITRLTADKESPISELFGGFSAKLLVSLVVSLIASSFISEEIYNNYLLFANATSFDKVDPLFGRDIGYYIFTRPFLAEALNSLLAVWMAATIYAALSYAIIYIVNRLMDLPEVKYEKPVVIHNVANIALYFLLKATTYKFKSEEVLYSTIGDFAGAGFTDINIWYNFYRFVPFFLVAIVIAAVIFLYKNKIRQTLITVALYPVSLVLVSIVAVVVQGIFVSPNEAVKERPYLMRNMEYTKMAYKLDGLTELEHPITNMPSKDEMGKYADTLNNIAITDQESTLTANNALQGVRNYYKFKDVDILPYEIGGERKLVSVSAREMDKSSLTSSAQTYVNRVFRFTHGFGAVMSSASNVTEEGQPEFLIKDIPPTTQAGAPQITQPRIYYGEVSADDYVIVNSTIRELDYTEGSTEREFSYDGKGGIALNFFNRLIYAVKHTDFKMLMSGYITGESKILINRNIITRLEKAAPFLRFDSDPYLVIDGAGRLKWVVDAYTTSAYYPYSQTYDDINYIRNSVRAVVDAYDGDITLYVIDPLDPIIASYQKIYPEIFSAEPIPEDIRVHTVYPQYLFGLQAKVYGRYHVTNPNTFYNESDLWVMDKEIYHEQEKSLSPYYCLIYPEGDTQGMQLMSLVPYTLANKENMVGYLAVNCEEENYGQLYAYQFPRGSKVYGTMQIESRIDNDPLISREMSLWGQGGSQVIRGNMLAIPVGGSLLYIEPIYISSQSGAAIPELKRVAVAYNDKIVMEPTLRRALEVIFEGKAPTGPVGTLAAGDSKPMLEPEEEGRGEPKQELDKVIERITEGYYNAQNYAAQGDWNGFGTNMQELDEAVQELQQFHSDRITENQ
ncbi:MAG: UPF0182 family protein [Ruminococcaceae bacterium]|nr:UPF0182 family protein [Oscillospiraceae bacterium]